MKKRLFLTALAVLVVLSLGCVMSLFASAAEGPTMTLGSATNKAVNDEVTLDLSVSDFGAYTEAAQILLQWDPSKLSYVGAAVGEIISGGTYFSATTDSEMLAGGECELGYMGMDDLLTASDGSIAQVTFKVLASGTHTIEVTVEAFGDMMTDYAGDFATVNGSIATGAPVPAYDGPTIYIADIARGTGDGSSADNAMGNDEAYQEALDLGFGGFVADPRYSEEVNPTDKTAAKIYRYRGSALWKAVDALKETGGMVVICGDVTVSFGNDAGGSTNFDLPSHSQNVIITSKNGSEDYTATASLDLNNNNQKLRFRIQGPTTFDGLTFKRTYDSSANTLLYLCACGKKLVIGEDVSFVYHPVNGGADNNTAVLPILVGGNMWGKLGKNADGVSVDMTVLGGEYYKVEATNDFPNDTGEIAGDVNVTLGNVIVYNAFYVGCIQSVSAAKPGNIMGDVNITLDGADIRNVIYLTGAVSTSAETKACGAVKGNVNLTIAGTTKAKDIYFGYGGFLNDYDPIHPENGGKCTVSFVGADWTLIPSFGFIYWGGSGSNRAIGYNYTVLDFSGMTYNEFYGKHIMVTKGTVDKKLVETWPVRNLSVNGAGGTNGSYGVDEAILPALWIADKPANPANPGDGSGCDEQNPIYNSDAYNASLGTGNFPSNTLYQESALAKAFKKIATSGASYGGTVKFAGDVTLSYGDTVGTASNFNVFGNGSTQSNKKITVDGCGHTLTFDAPTQVSGYRIMVRCPSEWDNMTVKEIYRYSNSLTSVNLYNTGYGINWGFNGYKTVIGENVNCVSNLSGNFGYPILIAGNMWGNLSITSTAGNRGLQVDEAVNLTVKSGTWSNIHLTGQFPNGTGNNTTGKVTAYLQNTTVLNFLYGCHTRSLNENCGGIRGDVSVTLDHATVANVMMTTPWGSSSTTPKNSWATIVGNVDFTAKNGSQLTGITYFTPTSNASAWDASYNYGTISGNVTVTIDGTGTGDPVKFNRIDLGARGLASDENVFTLKFLGDNWNCTNTSATPIVSYMGSGSNFYGPARNATIDFSGMTYEQFITKTVGTAKVGLYNSFYFNLVDEDTVENHTVAGIRYGRQSPAANPYGFNTVILPAADNYMEGISLTFDTDLTANIYFASLIPGEYKLTVTLEDGSTVECPYVTGGAQPHFAFEGINPQCMTDDYDLSLTKDGEVIWSYEDFSIVYFCNYMYYLYLNGSTFGLTPAQDEALMDLLATTLYYGAAAQEYRNYKADATTAAYYPDINLMGDYGLGAGNYTESVKSVGENKKPDVGAFKTATLYLANDVKFQFRIDNLAGSALKLQMKDATGTLATTTLEETVGEQVILSDLKIKATEFGKAFSAVLLTGEEEVQTVVYSVNSYLNFAKTSSNPLLATLASDMAYYGNAAVAYATALKN